MNETQTLAQRDASPNTALWPAEDRRALAGPSVHVSVRVQGGVLGHSLCDAALGEEGGPGLKTTTHCLSPGVPDGHLGSPQDSPLPLKPVVSAREGYSQLG